MSIMKEYLPWLYNFLKSENATILNGIIAFGIAAAFVYLVWLIVDSGILAKRVKTATNRAINNMQSNMKSSKLNFLNYESIDKFIKYTGLGYMFGKQFDPIMFMGVNILLTLLGFYIGWKLNPLYSLPLAVAGFFLLTGVGILNNSSDNNALLEDVKQVYDTLRIQTKAGVFLTSALSECYLVVRNKRLKKALIELANDLLVKNDLEAAADEFQGKFKNQYIDQMAVIIKQSQESGRAAQMFDDISGQIDDIQAAINLKEKEKIRTQITICQTFVYIQILAVVIFQVLGTLGNDLGF